MNNNFLQTMDKYGLLDNNSNKIAQFYFDKIMSDKTIDLKEENSLKYGWIYLSVIDGNNFELFYNDICLIKCSESRDYLIPCVFDMGGKIVLKGQSGEVRLFVYGATSKLKEHMYLLPYSKYIVKDRGNLCILSYENIDDVVGNNLTQIMYLANCMDIREINLSGSYNLLWLSKNGDNLYLYKKLNDNTTTISLGSGISDARIISHYGAIYVVYIKDEDIYYRSVDLSENSLGNETQVNVNYKYVPKSFSKIQLDNISSCGYLGINFDDGCMQVYKFSQTNFQRILSKRADYSKIIINDNDIDLITMTDYEISLSKYITNSSGDIELQGTPLNIYNVNDLIKIDSRYFVFSNGVFSEVSYDTN